MRMFQNANFPFVEKRFIAYAISLITLIAAIIGIAVKGFNWSTDFTGGVATTINMQPKAAGVQPLHIDKLRKVVTDSGFREAEIQYIGNPDDANFQIKVKGTNEEKIKADLISAISTKLGDYTKGRDLQTDVFREINTVGAKAGSQMRTNVLVAVFIALILMIIYIWVRFEFTFGVMGILALFHDTILIMGVFAWTQKEMTMQIIAALLTLIGYSINDTIVVFDRIREDLKVYRKDPIPVVFNRAMNQTLSRTVITGGTTLLTALSLYFFGGSVIHDFALAIWLGIIVGTYSSIFVASNLVIDTYRFSHKERQSIKALTKKK